MVYSNRFVACVLVNGTPQKELANGVVPLPFGTEYSLRFRNKHNRRAVVKFTVDGENVSGGGYVVNAHSSIDIHRHFDKDARFKFVSLESPDAVEHGKNGPNDDGIKGVVEAKFYLEKEQPKWHYTPVEHHHHWYNPTPIVPWPNNYPMYGSYNACGGSTTCSTGGAKGMSAGFTANAGGSIPETINFTAPAAPPPLVVPPIIFPCCNPAAPQPTLQEGCTVEGSVSGQTFSSVHLDMETDYVLVRLVLKGGTTGQAVAGNQDYCTGCGARRHKSTDRFCASCGNKF